MLPRPRCGTPSPLPASGLLKHPLPRQKSPPSALRGCVGVTLRYCSTEQPHDDLTIPLCPPLHRTRVLDTLPAAPPHPPASQRHLHPARTGAVPGDAAGMRRARGCLSGSGRAPQAEGSSGTRMSRGFRPTRDLLPGVCCSGGLRRLRGALEPAYPSSSPALMNPPHACGAVTAR